MSGEWTAQAHVEIFQVFESDCSLDVDKEDPQRDGGQAHTTLWGHTTTHMRRTLIQACSPDQQWKDFLFRLRQYYHQHTHSWHNSWEQLQKYQTQCLFMSLIKPPPPSRIPHFSEGHFKDLFPRILKAWDIFFFILLTIPFMAIREWGEDFVYFFKREVKYACVLNV